VLGTILIERNKTNVAHALSGAGVPAARASKIAASFGQGSTAQSSAAGTHSVFAHPIALATAESMQTVFYVMAGVMAATFVVSLLLYPRGKVEVERSEQEVPAPARIPVGAGVADAG